MGSVAGRLLLELMGLAASTIAVGCSSNGSATAPPVSGLTCPQAVLPGGDSTAGVLAAQGPDCLPCAVSAGCLDPSQSGGCCEIVAGNAASGGLTESALCFKTMNDIFSTECVAASLDPVSCYCGSTNPACLDGDAGGPAPTGPLLPDYVDDFGTNIATASADFESPAFGAGEANNVVHCAAYFGCDCFGSGSLNAPMADGGGSD